MSAALEAAKVAQDMAKGGRLKKYGKRAALGGLALGAVGGTGAYLGDRARRNNGINTTNGIFVR